MIYGTPQLQCNKTINPSKFDNNNHNDNKLFSTFFRSNSTGNCLYSSISILLVGNNSLMLELRLLTSIELCLNAEYYKSHPVIHTTYKAKSKLFQNALNLFQTFISENAYKTGKQACDLVIEEARLNCIPQTWCGFLCVLALSSVTQRTINSFYPDSKVHDAIISERYTVLFNQKIHPRERFSSYSSEELNILFCFSGKSV